MRYLFIILFYYVFAYSQSSDLDRQTLNLLDPFRDMRITSTGAVSLENTNSYTMTATPIENGQKVALKPKNSNRDPLYFITKDRGLRAGYHHDVDDNVFVYSTTVDTKIDEIKNAEGKVEVAAMTIGPHTLICEPNTNKNAESDRICVVANKYNCDQFYQSVSRSGMNVDRKLLLSCNLMFNSIFGNAQFVSRNPNVPDSLYLAHASRDVLTMTGQNYSFTPFSTAEFNQLQKGNSPLTYLHRFFAACEVYQSDMAATVKANSESGNR